MDANPSISTVIPVIFDLRFAAEKCVHDGMMKTRKELVMEFGRKHRGDRISEIQLYPVERAGKSGSAVFYLDILLNEISFPERFIAKFQNRDKTNDEVGAATWAEIGQLCTGIYSAKHESDDLGLVVYKLAAAPDHTEFRGFFLDGANRDEDCVLALKSALQLVGNKRNSSAPTKKIVEDYKRYVERKSRPLLKLHALSDASADDHGLASLAKSVISGYDRICNEYNVDVHGYLVHGDLHARNLMISKMNPARTELIDFDWVHFGHPAKDFVLMESTVKYMLLAELVAKAVRGTEGCKESPHISVRCTRDFEGFLFDNGLDLPPHEVMVGSVLKDDIPPIQRAAIVRAYKCIVQIRASAKLALDAYCKQGAFDLTSYQHYLISFYLVTFGLLAIPDVNQTSAMIGLSIISERLNVKEAI